MAFGYPGGIFCRLANHWCTECYLYICAPPTHVKRNAHDIEMLNLDLSLVEIT